MFAGGGTGSDLADDFDVVEYGDAQLPEAELERITKWLDPTDYLSDSAEFKRHLAARAPETGSWIRDTEAYGKWATSARHGALWIKGVPGAGKSVLAASVADHLRRQVDHGTDDSNQEDAGGNSDAAAPVLFFFFRHIVHANRWPRCLARDWLAQLLPRSLTLQGSLAPVVKSRKRVADVSTDAMWQEHLLPALARLPRVFCVVDALDEMDTTQDGGGGGGGGVAFFRRLNSLATFRPEAVKLFMTSRPRQDLQSCLSATEIVHISLEEDRVGHEIGVFVKHRLGPYAAKYESLAADICRRSNGLFLYARLLIDQLLPTLRLDEDVVEGQGKTTRTAISMLPLHLEDMYNGMLQCQANKMGIETTVQVELLGFVTHCARPLRLRELASLLTVRFPNLAKDAKNVVRQACHPLIEIVGDETVQVIHHSVSEFLLDANRCTRATLGANPQFPVFVPSEIHRYLALACLDINVQAAKRDDFPGDVALEVPIIHYSARHWGYHLQRNGGDTNKALVAKLEEFRSLLCQSSSYYSRLCYFTARNNYSESTFPWTLLHLAALVNLPDLARALVAGGDDNVQDDAEAAKQSKTPFAIACINQHLEIMRILWKDDTPSQVKSAQQRYELLQRAFDLKNLDVLEFLMTRGIHPALSKPEFKPILESLHKVNPAIFSLALPHVPVEKLPSLASECALKGDHANLKLMLDQTNIDKTSIMERGSLLYQICSREKKSLATVESVRTLLSATSDINERFAVVIPSEYDEATRYPQKQWTVLHALVGAWSDENHEWSAEICRLMVNAGADLEAADAGGDTPIFALFPESHARPVCKPLQYLLEESPVRVSAPGQDKGGLLHRAVKSHRDVALLDILLSHGLDVSTLLPAHGETMSPVIAEIWDWKVISLFGENEKKGAGKFGNDTPAEIAKYLVSKGATIDAGGDPAAVIDRAIQSCTLDSLLLLLGTHEGDGRCFDECLFSLGVYFDDNEANSIRPNSGIDAVEPRDLLQFIRALVKAGANIEARHDGYGTTPLLHNVSEARVFNALLEAGADRDARAHSGHGALFCYFTRIECHWRRPYLKRLEELVDMGYDPCVVDDYGNTLLHVAIAEGAHRADGALVDKLLGYGISARTRNKAGLTPLHGHFRADPKADDNHECLSNLLASFARSDGVDVNHQDNDGLSPVHVAAISPNTFAGEYLETLQRYGADLNLVANGNRSILHLACRARNVISVDYLVRTAPELVEREDDEGRTPLFDACISGAVESVGTLLRAGAAVNKTDKKGWTPLHACAEFGQECRLWAANERRLLAGETIQTDRLRPYIPVIVKPTSSDGLPTISTGPHVAGADYSLDEYDHRRAHDIRLGNDGLAIAGVVGTLLDAGADTCVRGGIHGTPAMTPLERARHMTCLPVLQALETKAGVTTDVSTGDGGLSWAPDPPTIGLIKEQPANYLGNFTVDDVSWLKRHDANLFGCLTLYDYTNVLHKGIAKAWTFVQGLALEGQTEMMAALGEHALRGEDLSQPTDRWTLQAIEGSGGGSIPAAERGRSLARRWTTSDIKTVGDFLSDTPWREIPLVQAACLRASPNLEMLRTLVERCGASVNSPTCQFHGTSQGRGSGGMEKRVTTLHLLAEGRHLWHLDAIRYFIDRGCDDLRGRDFSGRTPLHVACESQSSLAPRFVRLLLDHGADPMDRGDPDCCDRTCFDQVQNGEVLRILLASSSSGHDATMLTKQLFLGIGALDADHVRVVLDAGADPNGVAREQPVQFTVEEIDWQIHDTPTMYSDDPVPLEGALLYHDYGQVETGPGGQDRREAVVRVLIEKGADVMGPIGAAAEADDAGGEDDEDARYTVGGGESDDNTARPGTGDDADEEHHHTRLLHCMLRRNAFERKYLDMFLQIALDRDLELETRDEDGCTLFLAACDAIVCWYPDHVRDLMAYRPWKSGTQGNPDESMIAKSEEARKRWDSTDMFLHMLDMGVDVCAVDKTRRNALHILLNNLRMPEQHILAFLAHPSSKPLLDQADASGFTPIQYALRNLRPASVTALLDLGVVALPRFDPAGYGPLHHIAGQCLGGRRDPARAAVVEDLLEPLQGSALFLSACRTLWTRLVSSSPVGGGGQVQHDVDEPDQTGRGDPPLFHYLASNPETSGSSGYSSRTAEAEKMDAKGTCCHVRSFESFFGTGVGVPGRGARLDCRNAAGDTALHVVAANRSLDGERLGWFRGRSDKHDADVFRFLVREKGLDPWAEDGRGRSSLDVAAEGDEKRQAILDVFKER